MGHDDRVSSPKAWLCALLVLAAACGAKTITRPDVDGGAVDSSTSPDSSPPPPPRDGGPVPVDADPPPPPPPPPPVGECTSRDARRIGRSIHGPDGTQTVDDVAESCGIGCIADPDLVGCTASCVVAETDITLGCARCYGGSFACGAENCIGECLADPGGPACIGCRCGDNPVGINCIGQFDVCTGVTMTACPG